MKLIAVTVSNVHSLDLAETLVAIEPYIDRVILREKSKTDTELLDLIQTINDNDLIITKIIIHGSADLAAAVNINDIQVPGHGLPLPFLKRQFPELSFGKSVHSFEEAKTAVLKEQIEFYTVTYLKLVQKLIATSWNRRTSANYFFTNYSVYAIGGIQPNHIEPLRRINVSGHSCYVVYF